MGLHRKDSATEDQPSSGNRAVLRRIWWSVFALDRLNAAQEGTPFLINEVDCDAEMLTEDDFTDDDSLTCQITMLNLDLAWLVQDAVRTLYAAGEDRTTLFSTRGVLARQRLTLELEQLSQRIVATLLPGQDLADALQQNAKEDIRRLWSIILLTHVDAVRILVHRPFITYAEPRGSLNYFSRDACRSHALDIVSHLSVLQSQDSLRFSWPFTVYAVVNCLLIFWYDVSSPPKGDQVTDSKACHNYAAVVRLLRDMGVTWWAAAAKHKLAEALAKAASQLRAKDRGLLSKDRMLGMGTAAPGDPSALESQQAPTPHSGGGGGHEEVNFQQWSDDSLFSGTDNTDFWASMGLNFDSDVADNVFSIWQADG